MIKSSIDEQRKRLFKMYLRDIITYEEFKRYLDKLDSSSLKEPPSLY